MQIVKNPDESHKDSVKIVVFPMAPIELKNKKYLASKDMSFGQFLYKIRQSFIKIKPEEALFCYVLKDKFEVLVPVSQLLSQLQQEYAQKNGEVHLVLRSEEVFGYC